MWDTYSLSIVPITREAIDTGPTERCLELPRIAYIKGGAKLESELKKEHFTYQHVMHQINWARCREDILSSYLQSPVIGGILASFA